MKSRAYQTTPTPVLDLLPSLLTTKTNRPHKGAQDTFLQCGLHLCHGCRIDAGGRVEYDT